ncbi:MAG: phosphate ABC transporter ATP-binding protein [Candidatus Thermoplasmatota archaeon]
MTISLELEGIQKDFDGRKVLQGVDLRVEAGEVFALVGPSGVGKTTLLRCVDFLLRPDGGSVRYGGQEAPRDPGALLALRRRIGFVAQNPLLFRGSVFYNVSFGLCVRGVEGRTLEERTYEALDAVGLHDFAETKGAKLSAGEAQRVAFARAIVVHPEILLLDEFTANLDPANVAQLETAVAAYHRQAGATVLIVTHNLFQAKRVANRAGFLFGGQIVEIDEVDRFFTNPQDERTRAFVRGEMPY